MGTLSVFGDLDVRAHRMLYSMSNMHFFTLKYYGIIVAMPWELCYELAMEETVDDAENEILIRFGVAIGATVVLSCCGLQFVEVLEEARQHSIAHGVLKVLKHNYRKVKKLKQI